MVLFACCMLYLTSKGTDYCLVVSAKVPEVLGSIREAKKIIDGALLDEIRCLSKL